MLTLKASAQSNRSTRHMFLKTQHLTCTGGGDPSVLNANYPPQLTVGRRPLGGGGGGGGGGASEGGFREGEWGGGDKRGRGGGPGGSGGGGGPSGAIRGGGGGGGPGRAIWGVGGGEGLTMPAMLIGLNKIPRISFMAAFATSLLSILDPNTHSDQGESQG